MKAKRIIGILGCIMLLVLLVGCGNDNANKDKYVTLCEKVNAKIDEYNNNKLTKETLARALETEYKPVCSDTEKSREILGKVSKSNENTHCDNVLKVIEYVNNNENDTNTSNQIIFLNSVCRRVIEHNSSTDYYD